MVSRNTGFNFEEYAVKVVQHIDSLRSILTWADGDEAKENSDAKPKESRINALYRAIGLPTVIPDEKDDNNKNKFNGGTRPDKFNNGNIHKTDFNKYKQDLDLRQLLFKTTPTEQEISEFLTSSKYNFRSSIVAKNEDGTKFRSRGSLFPMVVDGRIHVQPQNRRVAGAFSSNSERRSKSDKNVLYHQPMIETILYMRLKGDNLVNTVESDSVLKDFDTGAAKDLVNYDLQSLKQLDKESEKKLNKTLNSIGPLLKKTIQKFRRAKRNTGLEVVPSSAAVAQQNPKTRLTLEKRINLDIQKARQDDRKAIEDAVLSILQYEAIDKRNVLGGALAGSFIEILTPKKKSVLEKERQRTKEKIDKQKSNIKDVYRTMELLLGTFAGLSGIDVLAITTALYKIDTEYLVALLNPEARKRLALVKGADLKEIKQADGIDVVQAINKLQEVVIEVIDDIILSTSSAKIVDDPQYKSEE